MSQSAPHRASNRSSRGKKKASAEAGVVRCARRTCYRPDSRSRIARHGSAWRRPDRQRRRYAGQGDFRRGRVAWRTRHLFELSQEAELRTGRSDRRAARERAAHQTAMSVFRHLRRLLHAAPRCARADRRQAARARRQSRASGEAAARNGVPADSRSVVGISLSGASYRAACGEEGRCAGRLS